MHLLLSNKWALDLKALQKAEPVRAPMPGMVLKKYSLRKGSKSIRAMGW